MKMEDRISSLVFSSRPAAQNLKHQHVLQQFLDGSIAMIGCTSPAAEQKKAEHVREAIDQELGITTPFNCLWSETKVNSISSSSATLFSSLSKAYFYVEDCTDIVLGYCLAHIVHRVTKNLFSFLFSSRSFVRLRQVHVLDLTNETEIDNVNEVNKMLCGIARIWVHPDRRRARIATKLLDCVR